MVAVRIAIVIRTSVTARGLLVACAYVPEAQFDEARPTLEQIVDSVEAME